MSLFFGSIGRFYQSYSSGFECFYVLNLRGIDRERLGAKNADRREVTDFVGN